MEEDVRLVPKFIRETSIDVVRQMLEFHPIPFGSKVLEPSAGKGILLDHITTILKGHKSYVPVTQCVELNKENREILKEKGYDVVGEDFLKLKPSDIEGLYSYIIATPTYKNNVDLEHIMHMYRFLYRGSTLISLTYPSWTTQNTPLQIRFREWLSDKDYQMKMLIDESYVENFKTQPSMMIKITKDSMY